MGSIVRIVLGERGVSRGGTIVLKYDDVTVQREVATGDDKIGIQAFSGDSPLALALRVVAYLNSPLQKWRKTQSR